MSTVDAVQVLGEEVYWIAGGPDGDRLRCWSRSTRAVTTVLDSVTVGTGIYGYGGGAYVATPDGLFASDHDTAAILHQPAGSEQIRVLVTDGWHYGDLHWTPARQLLLAVRERGATAQVVAVDPARGEVTVLAHGEDFYAAPRVSPDGESITWLSWNVPAMPWDRTTVWLAPLTRPGSARRVLDGDESAFCPRWSPDGVLHVVTDRTGWWNLHRLIGDRWEPVVARDAELGVAQWELGYATYALLGEDRLALIAQRGPHHELLVGRADALRPVAPAYTSIKPYLGTDGRHLAFIGASVTQEPTVVTVDLATGRAQELTSPVTADNAPASEPFVVRARDGRPLHGLYWPPCDRRLRPPTVLRAHPGPTAAGTGRLDDYVRFFTDRGYAVADLDYRGSTGHGRDHRHALRGQWGIADAHDCIDAARHLIDHGRADPRQTMISGASAGGFTALHALADPDTPFAAATARSAVIDPVAWRAAAPRFQAHHTDLLIGPWPDTAATHHERSLLTQAHHSRRPVLLIHGTDDTIAPPAPALHLAAALRRAGVACTLLTLDHEGHTLTGPATHAAHVAELRHYATIT